MSPAKDIHSTRIRSYFNRDGTWLRCNISLFKPGDAGSPNTPQVEDWNDGGNLGGKDFDL